MNYFEVEQHFWRRMNEEGGVIPTLQAMGKTIVVAEGSHPARVRSTSQHSHPARWPRSGEVPLSRRACTQCFPQTRRPGQSSAARTISTSRTRTSRASPSHLRSTVSGSCSTCRGAVFVSRCSVVAGHLTQSLPYRFSVQVLLQLLYHFRRVWYTS